MANIFDLFEKIKTGQAKNSPPEFIVAGLGNPGKKYAKSRHNAGFMVLDALAAHFGAEVKRSRFNSLTGTCAIAGRQCLLMKPQTYMNNSGTALEEAASYYKIPIQNVLVMYDDVSLEPSRIRIRLKGSHGGHNGIRSIVDWLNGEEFPRIKIGVGGKPERYDLADWVLSGFTDDETKLIAQAAKNAVEAAELIVKGEPDEAMNRFNGK